MYSSITLRRSFASCSLWVWTFMPASTGVVHEAGKPLRPSISIRQRRQEPKALERVGGAEFRYRDVGERGRAHHRGARGNGNLATVNFERDEFGRIARRRAEILVVDR